MIKIDSYVFTGLRKIVGHVAQQRKLQGKITNKVEDLEPAAMDTVCMAWSGWHVGRESNSRHRLARLASASNMDTNSGSSNFSCRDAATKLDMGRTSQHGTHRGNNRR